MERTLDPLALQFRSFLNAKLTIFQKPECKALGLSVLAFLSSSQFDAFDCSLKLLPLCNDDDPEGWKCSCESPLLHINTDGVLRINCAIGNKCHLHCDFMILHFCNNY